MRAPAKPTLNAMITKMELAELRTNLLNLAPTSSTSNLLINMCQVSYLEEKSLWFLKERDIWIRILIVCGMQY